MFSSIARIVAAGVPWLVIAALLYVALFVKPDPVGKTVIPSAIESRDRFYGIANPRKDVLSLVGRLSAAMTQECPGLFSPYLRKPTIRT